MIVQLRSRRPDAEVEAMLGRSVRPEDVAIRLEGDGTIFKPNGERLLTLRRGVVSKRAADAAYPFLHWLRGKTTRNRGDYAGLGRTQPLRKAGYISNTSETPPVRSAIVGSLDRSARMPFCRSCAASAERPEEWEACFPFVREVAAVFESVAPDRFGAQLAASQKTPPAYIIPGTPFTTLTVNSSVAGACHRDAGDYKPGLGVISVLRMGSYRGAELVFPAYGAAVDLRDRDVILFDPHEVHGNTPFLDAVGPEGDPDHGGFERISIVFYYRTGMLECGSPAEERERAKKLRGSLQEDATEEPEP